jgi:hypothetical protein
MRSHFVLLLSFLAARGMGITAPIPIEYQGSILEGRPGVDQGLPIYLTQSPNNVRFRFFVSNFSSIVSINSIDVSFDVYDDNANGFERGDSVFVLNGIGEPNVFLTSWGGLSGFTAASPLTIATSVPAGNLPSALLEIQGDGVFFIRINRNGNNQQGNDFFVDNVTVAIDGELVPEPGSFVLLAGGLAIGAIYRRHFRRTNR